MKTQEEIEQLAEQYWAKQPYNEDAYVVGYTQCQEDMADKKYTEEDILFAFVHGGTKFEENKDSTKLSINFKEFISLLNKLD